MKKLFAITLYTFQDAVRNKILYSILFFAVVLILLTVIMGAASLHQDERVVKDVGLFAISLFAHVIAIFLSVTTLYQELQGKTIFTTLSKPVPRPIYFFGKFLGMAVTLFVQLGLMAVFLTGVMFIRGDAIPLTYFYALWLTFISSLIVASFGTFFSSFSTPYVSGFITLGMWIVGSLIQELSGYLWRIEDALPLFLLKGVVALAPDLNLFNLTTQLTYGYAVSAKYVFSASSYGLFYCLILLISGAMVFQKRDFI